MEHQTPISKPETAELTEDVVGVDVPPLVVPLRVLRLTLKKKWFDMIASGEKHEEYREQGKWIDSRVNANKEYDVVEFKNGYGPHVPCCLVKYLGYDWTTGNPAWGAVPGKLYKVIRLGRVISRHNERGLATAPQRPDLD